MKKLLVILFCVVATSASPQIEQVTVQASGLTCSMCSKAIYTTLQKLSFAANITSNIKESSYTITFTDGDKADFDLIRKAIEDAGFSVAKMEVKAVFDNVAISNDTHITLAGKAFHFLDVKEQTLTGEHTFKIVDRKFVTEKAFKKYAATTKMECVKTGFMQSCCKNKSHAGSRIYHVTV